MEGINLKIKLETLSGESDVYSNFMYIVLYILEIHYTFSVTIFVIHRLN
jgi:hypothetical protein